MAITEQAKALANTILASICDEDPEFLKFSRLLCAVHDFEDSVIRRAGEAARYAAQADAVSRVRRLCATPQPGEMRAVYVPELGWTLERRSLFDDGAWEIYPHEPFELADDPTAAAVVAGNLEFMNPPLPAEVLRELQEQLGKVPTEGPSAALTAEDEECRAVLERLSMSSERASLVTWDEVDDMSGTRWRIVFDHGGERAGYNLEYLRDGRDWVLSTGWDIDGGAHDYEGMKRLLGVMDRKGLIPGAWHRLYQQLQSFPSRLPEIEDPPPGCSCETLDDCPAPHGGYCGVDPETGEPIAEAAELRDSEG